jgi:hypothetical protein
MGSCGGKTDHHDASSGLSLRLPVPWKVPARSLVPAARPALGAPESDAMNAASVVAQPPRSHRARATARLTADPAMSDWPYRLTIATGVAATNRRCHPVQYGRALLMMAALASSATACHSGRSDPRSMTSTELVAAGERDTAFVRRVRMFEVISAHIPTDSLARLYIGALDAPAALGPTCAYAIACQYYRMTRQFGAVAPDKAIRRMEDSLFTTPESRERWRAAQRRWPNSLGPNFPCEASDLRQAPESLNAAPRKMIWP